MCLQRLGGPIWRVQGRSLEAPRTYPGRSRAPEASYRQPLLPTTGARAETRPLCYTAVVIDRRLRSPRAWPAPRRRRTSRGRGVSRPDLGGRLARPRSWSGADRRSGPGWLRVPRRPDHQVAPGTTVERRPVRAQLHLGHRPAQDRSRQDTYEVVVIGTGRTTATRPSHPPRTRRASSSSQGPGDREIQNRRAFATGRARTDHPPRTAFTPGLGPVPFAVEFEYRSSRSARPAVAWWFSTRSSSTTHLRRPGPDLEHGQTPAIPIPLPVTRLPDRKY